MRASLLLALSFLPLLAALNIVLAQDYVLPNAPGKAELTGACETCHGIMTIALHKRSPRQWDTIVRTMIAMGASVSDDQKKVILAYLNTHFGQVKDFVPQPMPLRGRGPSLALAIEAAQTAQDSCLAKGDHVSTLVVDSGGNTVVLLTGDGAPPVLNAIAATKTATVLKFKMSSGEVMKRLDTDPILVAQLKEDPDIGEVRQGGLPITVNGELIGAIAVSGAFGPADKDETCAQAGLDRIASRLH